MQEWRKSITKVSLTAIEVYRGARAGPVSTNSLSPLFHPMLEEGPGRKGRGLPKDGQLAAELRHRPLFSCSPLLQHIAFSKVPKLGGDEVLPDAWIARTCNFNPSYQHRLCTHTHLSNQNLHRYIYSMGSQSVQLPPFPSITLSDSVPMFIFAFKNLIS